MNQSKLYDFDEHFDDYLTQWIQKNQARYQKPEDMEEAMPEVYAKWLNIPAKWLEGAKPGEYFNRFTSGEELCELVRRYTQEGVCLPDPLLDRLLEVGDEDAMMALLTDEAAPCEARMCMVDLLRSLESTKPMVDYLRWQVERKYDADLLDNALDSLRQMGQVTVRPGKIAFAAADEEGKEALLDLLADYPGDEDVFQFALRSFLTKKDKRALFAGYLAKLGDDRALEHLLDVAEGDEVTYADFLEIRSAIERLGGEAPVKDWTGDPTFQAFRQLQKAQMPKRKLN